MRLLSDATIRHNTSVSNVTFQGFRWEVQNRNTTNQNAWPVAFPIASTSAPDSVRVRGTTYEHVWVQECHTTPSTAASLAHWVSALNTHASLALIQVVCKLHVGIVPFTVITLVDGLLKVTAASFAMKMKSETVSKGHCWFSLCLHAVQL